MRDGTTAEDRALVERLRTVYDEIDPAPAHVIEAALGSFAWRDIDADIARLVADTADARSAALSGVRGADGDVQHARLVTFDAVGVTVEVEVAQTGDRRRLMGQLVPPAAAAVQILTPGGDRTVRADDLGRFVADDVPAGPVGLAITIPGAPKVIASAWITI
jgi:hypothetical protein